MNPLTLVKRIQKITSTEAALGISEEASWHAKYKESAYIFVGGIPFDLTEGDLLAVFAQYGEVVDVNLVRDKGTGKSKGFAFLAYEDQRSTILAVDNLNGAKVLGRIVRVDHVVNYKKKEEEDEEKEQQKREERGVCRAFQRGDCNRGAACKFSHNEQRIANTGWGEKDSDAKWGHDKYDVLSKSERNSVHASSPDRIKESEVGHRNLKSRFADKDETGSREEHEDRERTNLTRQPEPIPREYRDRHSSDKRSRHGIDSNKDENRSRGDHKERDAENLTGHCKSHPGEDRGRHGGNKQSRRESDSNEGGNWSREEHKERDMKNLTGQLKSHPREDRDRRGGTKQSRHESDSSYRHHREDERHSDRAHT